ncbi:MAG: sugar ABC transporter substrate-binding protein [Chloroflexi bacterium]|nr:sugar ABC transporter substrate-binding protein [Chloroflexota bacterium]
MVPSHHPRVSRRRILGMLSTGVASAALLAACGASSATTSSQASTSAKAQATATQAKSTPSSAKGTIRVALAGFDTAQVAVWQKVADAFHKDNPSITAKIENVPGNAYQKYETELAGGAGHDVYDYETKQLPAYGEKGVFTVLDPLIAQSKTTRPSDFFPTTWSKVLVDGKAMALPWDTTPVALFYSIDLFKAAGINLPPTDWTDKSWTRAAFVDTATKLTKGTGPGRQFGYFQSTWWVYGLPWIWSDGGHMFNKDITKAQLTSTEVINNWQFLQDLMWKQRVFPTAQESTQGSGAMFLTGKVGMYINGPYFIPSLLAGKASIKWNVAAIPSGTAGRWTRDPSDSVVIWKGSKEQDASWAFVEFVAGDKGQRIIGTGGRGVPARKAIARSKEFLNQPNGIDWKVFVDAVDHEGIQAVTDVWPQVDTTITQGLGNMWNNKETARGVATKLQPQIQAILDKAKSRRARPTYAQHGWTSSATGY